MSKMRSWTSKSWW